MSTLNVLLVSYSFPPAGGVGVLRTASLARYLPAEGIRLDVLTARNAAAVGSDPALIREIATSKYAPEDNARIVIAHAGTVYRTTDPTAVVEALQSLPPELATRFKLRFIGHVEEERFRNALLQLGEMVELKGFLPQREALALMEESDYALLISHDPLNVGAKFYDYIGSGKPILGALHRAGYLCRLLEDLRARWWVKAVRQLFVEAAARGKAPFTDFRPDTAKIAQSERRILTQRYTALLHSIACGVSESRSAQQDARSVAMGS